MTSFFHYIPRFGKMKCFSNKFDEKYDKNIGKKALQFLWNLKYLTLQTFTYLVRWLFLGKRLFLFVFLGGWVVAKKHFYKNSAGSSIFCVFVQRLAQWYPDAVWGVWAEW